MLTKPFAVIATAIAKSPNLEANIFESIRITSMLGERLVLIHVGQHTEEDEKLVRGIVDSCNVKVMEVELVWGEGDPVDVILDVSLEKKVDLIIAGALPREGLLRYYLGSIARRLVRGANCSVLLMTHPSKLKNTCGKIVVNGLDHPKTPYTIKIAATVAGLFGSSELTIVEEVDPSQIGTKVEDDDSLQKAVEVRDRIEDKEDKRIRNVIEGLGHELPFKITQKCIFGKRGYSIAHYAESSNADLLVMNSPDTKLGFLDRVFTHDLEYVLSELPSDLLIVHSHENKG